MGKATRRKRNRARPVREVTDAALLVADKFIASLGAMPPVPAGEFPKFWKTLEARHGVEVSRGLYSGWDVAAERQELKDSCLELSLDVDIGYSGHLYRQQMAWTARALAERTPGRVLDVGCGNGLLTCFYAQLWPEAEVVGFDLAPKALERASELADRTGVAGRTAWSVGNLIVDGLAGHGDPFDAVISSRALANAAVPRRSGDYGLTAEHGEGLDQEVLERAVSQLVNATAPDGLTVILDRLTKPYEIAQMAAALEAAGTNVGWRDSLVLMADELLGASQPFPLILASRAAPPTAATPAEAAVGFRCATELDTEQIFDASAAEALARSLRRERLLFSARVSSISDYGDELITAYEVWDCAALVLNFQTNSLGSRTASLHAPGHAAKVVDALREQLEGAQDCLIEFDTPPLIAPPAPRRKSGASCRSKASFIATSSH